MKYAEFYTGRKNRANISQKSSKELIDAQEIDPHRHDNSILTPDDVIEFKSENDYEEEYEVMPRSR